MTPQTKLIRLRSKVVVNDVLKHLSAQCRGALHSSHTWISTPFMSNLFLWDNFFSSYFCLRHLPSLTGFIIDVNINASVLSPVSKRKRGSLRFGAVIVCSMATRRRWLFVTLTYRRLWGTWTGRQQGCIARVPGRSKVLGQRRDWESTRKQIQWGNIINGKRTHNMKSCTCATL